MKRSFNLLFCLILSLQLVGQQDYKPVSEISSYLQLLHAQARDRTSLEQLTTSPGGHPVWMLKVGAADDEFVPGIAIVAGLDGNHQAGTEMVLQLANQLINGPDSVRALVNDRVFYFFPLVNPDAYQQFFGPLRYERSGNARETDIDRDGKISEDPYEDLNGDGLITVVRIEDASGSMTISKEDERVLIPVKERKPGMPIYRVFSEGYDNDKDGQFNEDGPGGVAINNNFPFQFKSFSPGVGEFPMSENENSALADFLFERWNIYAVFTFGLENSLSHPIKFDRAKSSARIISAPLEQDAGVNEVVHKMYSKVNSLKDAVEMPIDGGAFSTWAYYHYGRFSFVTPGWIAPNISQEPDTSEAAPGGEPQPGKVKKADPNYDLRFLKWAEAESLENVFVPWAAIDHPDFPGMKAEVGGFAPFVRYNPPIPYLEQSIDEHLQFIAEFSSSMPQIEFQGVHVQALGNSTFRINGQIVNAGILPTHTELGDRTRWVRDIRNRILLGSGQTLLLGVDRSFHKSLQPGEKIDFSWLVSGSGSVTLEAGSPMTGLKSISVELK